MATPSSNEKKRIFKFGKSPKNKQSGHVPKYSTNSFDGDIADFYANDDHKDNNMIVYESWLNKKGKINKSWKERYCVIYTDRKLAYFRRANDATPAGFIFLKNVTKIDVYLPQILDDKIHKNNRKNGHIHSNSSMTLQEVDEFKSDFNQNIKRQRSASLTVKTESLKGDKHKFGFDLVTNKRRWTFSTSDMVHFTEWIKCLRNLSFGKALYKGYLRKTGGKISTWHRRYFIIYDCNEIRYFENDSLEKQKGKIELNTVTKITTPNGNKYHYQFCMELHTASRVWVLAAESSKSRGIWINGIRSTMKDNQISFVPSASGFLSIYNSSTCCWIKYFFAVHKQKTGNFLCCFENQIKCKQLESMTFYGEEQFNLMCKTKMKQIISLQNLMNVISIQSFEFRLVHEECKQDMSNMTYLFHVKLQDIDYYFATHPNTQSNAQKWVNIIKNCKSSQRQNTFSKLLKIGYKSSYIAAAIEQYENAYGTKTYRFDEIKLMIDRMAKPETGSATPTIASHSSSSSLSPASSVSPIANSPLEMNRLKSLQVLNEDKSFSVDKENINASYNKILNEKNSSSWSVNDVIIWFKTVENGLITKKYPAIFVKIRQLSINGEKLKELNNTSLQLLGIKDDINRALILEAITSLSDD